MSSTAAHSREPALIGLEAVAARTGLPVRTIRELRARRQLPAVRIGKRVYFRAEDVDRWIADQFRNAGR